MVLLLSTLLSQFSVSTGLSMDLQLPLSSDSLFRA